MGIRWQDKVTDLKVLDRAGLDSIVIMIVKAQLRWTGHVIRMDISRIPRQLLYGVLAHGRRNLGPPKKRYKDCVNENLKYSGVAVADLERSARRELVGVQQQTGPQAF